MNSDEGYEWEPDQVRMRRLRVKPPPKPPISLPPPVDISPPGGGTDWVSIGMIAFFVIAFLFTAAMGMKSAHGSPLDCESIQDADRREFCRALATGKSTYCEFIKDRDMRAECRARVKP